MPDLDSLKVELGAIASQVQGAIGAELGTFTNGQPAIYRGRIPINLKTTGLQCIIQPVKVGDVIPMSSGQKLADQAWAVELINFADDAKLAIAKAKIEQAFVMVREARYVPPTDLNLEQCRFWLYAPTVFNPR